MDKWNSLKEYLKLHDNNNYRTILGYMNVLDNEERTFIHQLSKEGQNTRPWQIGDKVRYTKTIDWGPSKGATGIITRIDEKDIGKPGNEYQVFWVSCGKGIFWTTPSDVVLVEDETNG
jgi:hypothetical protein